MDPERAERVMRLHQEAPVIDCHNDSIRATMVGDARFNPLTFHPPRPRRLWQRGASGHWDFPRALAVRQAAQVTNLLVPWVKDGPYVRSILKAYRQLTVDLEHEPELALLARTAADIDRAAREGKVAVLLSIEGAEGIAGELDILYVYHQLGVRSMGLTWMYRNEVAEGNWEDSGAGLSSFGSEVVSAMNELHMLVDVAHSTEQTFWDVLEASTRPVICSHTSCRALVRNFHTHAPSRYLSDEQMKALADRGGVLGIFFSANRELEEDRADVHALARFFAHAADVCGAEHVGLGSDFDGGFPPHGLEDMASLPNLTSALLDTGFDDAEVRGLLGGNWLRVFRDVLDE